MKRINLFMIAAIVAASAMFVSCGSDPSDEPSITIRFNGTTSADGVFAPDDLYVGNGADDGVEVEVEFNAPGKIKEIRLSRASGSGTLPEGTFPKTKDFLGETIDKIKWTVKSTDVGTVKYAVEVTDKDKEPQSATKIVEITFKERPPVHGDIKTHTDVTIGSLAYTGSANSACASIDGTTYAVSGITAANQSKVDFIYFDGQAASNRDKSLAAPTNTNVGTLSGVSGWTNKNATKLAKLASVTTAQFDACNNDELILANVTEAAVTGDIVSQLVAGDVIGFIAASGKKGLIKVVSVDQSSAASNSIQITIKVQE